MSRFLLFLLADMRSRLDVFVNTTGGGITGQAGAIRQGIARALKVMFNLHVVPETPGTEGAAATDAGEAGLAKRLRDSGYLTRDGRMKERKRYGRKGARRGFQFSKRQALSTTRKGQRSPFRVCDDSIPGLIVRKQARW